MIASMASLRGRTVGCWLLACAALVVEAGDALGDSGAPVAHQLLVAEVAAPPAAGSVTYTPIRRPSVANPAAPTLPKPPSSMAPIPAVPTYPVPAPVAPMYAAPVPATPAYVSPVPAATTWATPEPYAPAPLSPSPPPGTRAPSSLGANAEPGAAVAAKAIRPAKPVHRFFGLAADVGMPDGLNLGLVVAPADWMRLGASIGTNSASLDYRGGLSLVPMEWGPSFSLEAGHCNTAATTGVIRTFFTVPSWVQPYVQQLGYTYFNGHVGFDYRFESLTLFIHGGFTYLIGTVRAPEAVVVDSKTNTSIKIAQDGSVYAYTLSAKAGLIYMFGGL